MTWPSRLPLQFVAGVTSVFGGVGAGVVGAGVVGAGVVGEGVAGAGVVGAGVVGAGVVGAGVVGAGVVGAGGVGAGGTSDCASALAYINEHTNPTKTLRTVHRVTAPPPARSALDTIGV